MPDTEITPSRYRFRDYLPLLAIAIPIILLDQVTKAVVRANLAIGEMWAPWDWLLPYARIFHVMNTGAAFGMLQSFGGVFMALSVVVAIAILYYFPQVPRQDWALRLAMGLQFGGAMGNLIDRLTIGWVTDFLSVGTFPVFNVADSCISIGVGVLLLSIWFKERDERAKKEAAEATQGEGDALQAAALQAAALQAAAPETAATEAVPEETLSE